MTYLLTVKVGLLFILFSVFDVWFKRKTYYEDLMMTKDEVKRERASRTPTSS
jgi:flagellar biosynthetic protein FlhB